MVCNAVKISSVLRPRSLAWMRRAHETKPQNLPPDFEYSLRGHSTEVAGVI